MIPLKYHTLAPYLYEKTRLSALSSGVPYASTELHDEHIMDRMNGILESLNDPKVHQTYSIIRTRERPDLNREKTYNRPVLSDIMLKDTFRQYSGMEEKYRRGLVKIEDIRRLAEPSTRYHIMISRGYERYLVDHINRLDGEGFDRKTIKPIIV